MQNSPYEQYKNSNSVWLGTLPSHWEVKKLKFVANPQPSNVDKKTIDDEIPVQLCNYVDVYKNDFIDSKVAFMQATATSAEIEKFKLNIGDVIVTKDSETPQDIAVPALVVEESDNLICGYHLTQIKQKLINGSFLFRLFQSKGFNAQFIVQANGVTRFGLPSYAIDNAFVPIPSLDEQQKIADFLDYKTTQIDALIEKKEALLLKLQEKRSALIAQAVTKGINPDVTMKDSGVEWLGEVPSDWLVLPLRRLVNSVKTGSTPTNVNEGHFQDDGLNWFRPGDFSNNIYLEKAEKSLSTDGATEVRTFPKHTVMHVGIGATIGKVAITVSPSSCNQQINAIVCNDRLDPIFAAYFLQSIKDYIVKCGKYTTLPIINQDETKSLFFTVPSLLEQNLIASYILKNSEYIEKQNKKINSAILLLREYRSALITNAVTGKIDVRDFINPEVKS
jgi:type I restriction enzyme S subunit